MLQYSFSLTTFSPSGKLVQIEYALNAVEAGATSLGIKATNGVVIATERKVGALTSVHSASPLPQSSHCHHRLHERLTMSSAAVCKPGPPTPLQVPSILVDESTVQKISLLTPNIGVVYSGMGPDSRVLIRKVRAVGCCVGCDSAVCLAISRSHSCTAHGCNCLNEPIFTASSGLSFLSAGQKTGTGLLQAVPRAHTCGAASAGSGGSHAGVHT